MTRQYQTDLAIDMNCSIIHERISTVNPLANQITWVPNCFWIIGITTSSITSTIITIDMAEGLAFNSKSICCGYINVRAQKKKRERDETRE